MGYRLAGEAKTSFASAVASRGHGRRYAINTYGEGVNWLLQKYASPDLLTAAYAEVIEAVQEREESPRAFCSRIEKYCGRLDGVFRAEDITNAFEEGLDPSVKAHVKTFRMTMMNATLPQVTTAAQIYWEGVQKIKIDVRRCVRNTTTPFRPTTPPPTRIVAAVTE